jgi:hypothetical protein
VPEFGHDVPVEYVGKVRDRVARAQKRAARLKVPVPSLTVGEPRLIPDPIWDGPSEDAPLISASLVTIEAPEHLGLPGWSLLARIDSLPDGSPLIVRAPGTEEVPLPDVEAMNLCVHCGKARRRNETFLVSGPEGIRQVGRNCLKDFLGASPEALLWWFRWTLEQREWMGGLGSDEQWTRLDLLLSTASQVAAHGGYMSKSKQEAIMAEQGRWVPTTRDLVDNLLRPPRNEKDRQHLAELEARYPADEGSEALWGATQAALDVIDASRSEWHANLALVASQEHVRPRHRGIAISAVVLGLQAQERDKELEEQDDVVSVPLGAIGERLRDLAVEVTFIRHFDGQYGTRTLVKVRDEAQQADLLWWASHYIPEDIVGTQVVLTGTVKAHEDDRFTHRPVTVVTRANIEEA